VLLIREAGPEDFPGVYRLAELLDSYNLPADRGYVRELLQTSRDSFAGRLPRAKARYLFVLERTRSAGYKGPGTLAGCSLIIAKHGTPGHPHLWFSLNRIIKYSRTLKIRRSHPVLRMGWTEDGPTEIGGLVVLPRCRKTPERCGLQVSYARFLYMGMHPERFEESVLVEYRGAMGVGGRSPFWEAVGRKFTGLSYRRADRLSVTNKEFILNLLPTEPIYRSLLPEKVQQAIGAIHPAARGAAHLAGRAGFRPIPQVEPFDGGPYYSAPLKGIRLIQRTRQLRVAAVSEMSSSRKRGSRSSIKDFEDDFVDSRWSLPSATTEGGNDRYYLVGSEEGGFFRAAVVGAKMAGGRIRLAREALERLNVKEGDTVHACPVPR